MSKLNCYMHYRETFTTIHNNFFIEAISAITERFLFSICKTKLVVHNPIYTDIQTLMHPTDFSIWQHGYEPMVSSQHDCFDTN